MPTFIWPISGATTSNITSGFGWRVNPITGERQHHDGIDLGYPTGTPIVTTASGTVTVSEFNQYRGNYIVIDHGSGFTTYSQHNDTNDVAVGDTVTQGQQIGTVGSTGDSTGPHLHFELRLNDDPIDPVPYLGISTISENRPLTLAEMTLNAQYITNVLITYGWTFEAICGMLGNMQSESTINPGAWEGWTTPSDPTTATQGAGLVQWTPGSKYVNWAIAQGYTEYASYMQIDPQLQRILAEVPATSGDLYQWIPTSEYNFSFQEFTKSKQSPQVLADAFLKNYERPANSNQPIRGTQALYWYETLDSSGNGGGVVISTGFLYKKGRVIVNYEGNSNSLLVRVGNNTFR